MKTNNTGRKVLAIVAVVCTAIAIILAAILVLGQNSKLSELEAKINDGTLTSADITAYAEAEGVDREEVIAIVAEYIQNNKIDTSVFATKDEVADMISKAIAAYDATRFDSNGMCLCCKDGVHEHYTTVDNTKTEYVDNSTHTTEYVENPVDLSNYYTQDEVNALIHEVLSQQVQDTIPETNSEDQQQVTNFIEADPGFQGEVSGTDDTFVQPGNGEQGAGGANDEPAFVEPGEGFQGENNNGGNANTDAPVGTGEVIDLRVGGGAEITDPVTPIESEAGFNAPSEGFEANVTGNSDNGFVAPATGEQGNGNASSDSEFVAPAEGYENGSSEEGQVIDLRGGANNDAPVEPTDPEVGFSGTDNGNDSIGDGFIMPSEGTGIAG